MSEIHKIHEINEAWRQQQIDAAKKISSITDLLANPELPEDDRNVLEQQRDDLFQENALEYPQDVRYGDVINGNDFQKSLWLINGTISEATTTQDNTYEVIAMPIIGCRHQNTTVHGNEKDVILRGTLKKTT